VNGGDVNEVEVRWKVLYSERQGEVRRGKLRKVALVEDGLGYIRDTSCGRLALVLCTATAPTLHCYSLLNTNIYFLLTRNPNPPFPGLKQTSPHPSASWNK